MQLQNKVLLNEITVYMGMIIRFKTRSSQRTVCSTTASFTNNDDDLYEKIRKRLTAASAISSYMGNESAKGE